MTTGSERPGSAAYPTPNEDKPLVVQEWLSGALSTRDAVYLALLGDDPAAKIWALHLMETMMVKPESFVRISGV